MTQFFDIELTETIMRTNANTLELLRGFLMEETTCIRINERFNLAEYQTTFLENETQKLENMFNLGSNSLSKDDNERRIRDAFGW